MIRTALAVVTGILFGAGFLTGMVPGHEILAAADLIASGLFAIAYSIRSHHD